MPLNSIEEAKFASLEKTCRELGVPAPPSIHINFEVKDKDGNLIFKDRQRGHSWTRNFYNNLFGSLGAMANGSGVFGAGYISAKRIGGVVASQNGYASSFGPTSYLGGVNSELAGILIGTSDTAFSAEDYAMGAIIGQGATSGKMVYGASDIGYPVYDNTPGAEKWAITHSRVFNNNSGADITVKEVGLAAYHVYSNTYSASNARFSASGTDTFLDERSVLSPTVAVPNGAQLTVTYEISMSFAAID